MQQIYFQPLIRIGILIIIFSFIAFIYHFLFHYLYPFFIAFIISMMLQPIVSHIEIYYKVNRTFASYIAIIFTASSLGSILFFLLQRIVTELAQLVELLPATFHKINHLFIDFGQTTLIPIYDNLQSKLLFLPKASILDIEKTIPFVTGKLYESSNDIITNTLVSASTIITSTSQAGLIIIFILISVVMMTKDFIMVKQKCLQLIPTRIYVKGLEIIYHLKKSTLGLIKAHFFLACLTSCIVFIAFLVMDINHVFVLTLTFFLVDFIPYIGIGVIFIPWILFQFLNGNYSLTIQLISLYMFIIIIRQFIEPKIIATHLQIHPLIALFILFVSIQYFGISGILFTPFLLILLSAMHHANIFKFLLHYICEKK